MIAIVAVAVAPVFVSALTADDLNAQIAALMQQVASLQSKLSTPAQTSVQNMTTNANSTNSTNKPSVCPNLMRQLSRGASGDDVFSLQRYLLSQGLLTADALNGTYNAQTENAVQKWQARYGIVSSGSPSTTGWGNIGPRTIKLIALNCPPVTSSNSTNGQCPIAARPQSACLGSWQAVTDARGCTASWNCVVQLPASSSTKQTTPPANQCPVAARPQTACAGSWSAVVGANGCTAYWQCAITLPGYDSSTNTLTSPASCPTYKDPVCGTDEHLVSSGTDSHNCPLPQHCTRNVY